MMSSQVSDTTDTTGEEVMANISSMQPYPGVKHILNLLLEENKVDSPLAIKDKHKFVNEQINRKLSALGSPTQSVDSQVSNRPFSVSSPTKLKKFQFNPESLITPSQEHEYDIIKVFKHQRDKETNYQQEQKQSAKKVLQLLGLRAKYLFQDHQDYDHLQNFLTYQPKTNDPIIDWSKNVEPLPILHEAEVFLIDGVYSTQLQGVWLAKIHSIMEFIKHLFIAVEITNDKMISSFCYDRNKYLESKFKMHQIFNNEKEAKDQKRIKHRDFFSIMKIDNHVHHSQSMSAKHLLLFMKKKFETERNELVYYDQINDEKLSLGDICERFKFEPDDLNLDMLDVQADKELYKRFDRFTSKYSPLGQPIIRNIFLKSDNYNQGRYIAELTKEMFEQLNIVKYNCAEYRITVYGKSMREWQIKSRWLVKNQLQNPNVRWLIQIPRLYCVYKNANIIENFQDMIDNIFKPLFDITINPTLDPYLYQSLFQIVGFDTVEDETKYESFHLEDLKTHPKDWSKKNNPHFAYWTYYIYANIYNLNALRRLRQNNSYFVTVLLRGLNTFHFRPHCGEAGNTDHLVCAFFVAEGINHGLQLEQSPVLKYLYYMNQIGISMSPVSNNKLVCKYSNSPFKSYFQMGLNVTLSTDDPLMLHLTDDPLIEEYSIAAQIFDLSHVDLSELARNSIRQSSFEHLFKEFYLGKNYQNLLESINNSSRNNVSPIRFNYRQETLREEFQFLKDLISKK